MPHLASMDSRKQSSLGTSLLAGISDVEQQQKVSLAVNPPVKQNVTQTEGGEQPATVLGRVNDTLTKGACLPAYELLFKATSIQGSGKSAIMQVGWLLTGGWPACLE